MKQLLLISLLSTFYVSSYSQYNTKGELKTYFYEENINKVFEIDTSLKNFEEYGFEQNEGWENFNIGIFGSAQQSLKFEWGKNKGFKDGNTFFNAYKYDINSIKRYNVSKYPYSEFAYLNGSRLEQIASITHAQNIKNRFKYAFDIFGLSANGHYEDAQRTRNVAVSFYGDYSSKNKRYHLGTDFTYSTIKTHEIGGIKEDVLIDSVYSKLFYNPYLTSSTTEQSTFSIKIKNAYDFGFFRTDSISDSLSIKRFYATHRIKHSIGTNIVNNGFESFDKNVYSDNISINQELLVVYKDFFVSSDTTSNKLTYHNIPHRIAYEYLGTNNTDSLAFKNIRAEIALQHNNLEIWHNGLEYSTNNFMIDAKVESNRLSGSKLSYGLNTYYILSGFNNKDFHIKANIGYDFKKYGKVYGSILYENIRPTWIETHYISSKTSWNNSGFKNKQITEANFTYLIDKHQLKFEANLDLLANYIYFNNNSTPTQTDGKIVYWNISIQKNTKWKFLHWNSFIGFQTSNYEEILPLPKLFLKTSLYADFNLFKKNLYLSAGFDLRFNSSFKARAWNPVVAQFYVQKSTLMNYTPVVDVFINAKIKSVRIYAKLNYANEGLFVKNYYKALNYPSNGRTFSIGGSWRFFE